MGQTAAASRAAQAFCPGELVGRRYRVLGVLGRGGMGDVYEVHDLELAQTVALKTLRPELAGRLGAVDQLKREILLTRQIAHPNVCRTFDVGFHVGDDGGQIAFFTMELLQGETLAARLRHDGPIPPPLARRWALQVAEGLAAAHRAGVVHRDFKSSNIIVEESAGQRLVITDFGLARGTNEVPWASDSDGPVGTLGYMAPEQHLRSDVGPAADVYAAGVVLRQMLTGARPGEDVRASEPPPEWDSLLSRCLAHAPADRISDGAALLSAVRCLPDYDAAARGGRRRVRLLAGAAGAIAVGMVVWQLAGSQTRSADTTARPRDREATRAYRDAQRYLQRSDALAARDVLQVALARAPDQPLVLSALGEAFRQLGEERRAAEMARTAFARSRDLPARDRMMVEARYRETNREWEKARSLYQKLITVAPKDIESGLGYARVLQRIGSPDEAFAVLASLRKLPPPAGLDLRIDETEYSLAALIQDVPRAVQAARRAAQAAEQQHAYFRAGENRSCEAWALAAMEGRHDDVLRAMEAALRHYERAGGEMSACRAAFLRGRMAWDRGDREAALLAFRESAELARHIGAHRQEGQARFELAGLLGELGDATGPLAEAERLVAIGAEIGDRGLRFAGLMESGHWRAVQGSYASAAEELERAVAIGRALDLDRDTAAALDELGRVRLQQGEFATARRALQEALGLARSAGNAGVSVAAELGLVSADLADGRLGSARERLAVVLGRASGSSRIEALLLRAQVAQASGDAAGARAALREARERTRDTQRVPQEEDAGWNDMGLRLLLDIAEGRLLGASRRSTTRRAARELLEATVDQAHEKGWFAPEVEARLALAEIHLREGAHAAARAELEVAGEMIHGRKALRWKQAYEELSAATGKGTGSASGSAEPSTPPR